MFTYFISFSFEGSLLGGHGNTFVDTNSSPLSKTDILAIQEGIRQKAGYKSVIILNIIQLQGES